MSKIRIVVLYTLLLPVLVFAQKDSIPSGVYSWKEPDQKVSKNILSAVLLEGQAKDMEYLQMSANILLPAKQKTRFQVPENEEHLLLIKSGRLTITLKDSSWSIGGGSIALLMPGEKYTLQSLNKEACSYYTMNYRSKLPADAARGKAAGGSLVKDFSKIEFKPHAKGGVRNYFDRPTVMCKKFEMHVTQLNEGLTSHDPHTHPAEEIILLISNKTEMPLGGEKLLKAGAGDFYFIGSNISHTIKNDGKGPSVYFAYKIE